MNLRAYIELARLSNAPTIVSNVLVGIAIGVAGRPANGPMPWLAAAAMCVAILLLYVAGMALNDALDVKVDRLERPERPIPAGRVSLQGAYACASLCMAGGMAIAAMFGVPAAIFAGSLIVSIVIYDVLHKRHAWAAVFMGICRGLVYLTVAAAVAWPLEWRAAIPLSAAMGLYIVLVTLIARGEAGGKGASASTMAVRLSIFLIAAALAPVLWIVPADWTFAVIAALALIGWLVASQRFLMSRPARVRSAVMAFLAGICLVDAYYLALLDQPASAVIAWACFVATLVAHRRVSGT